MSNALVCSVVNKINSTYVLSYLHFLKFTTGYSLSVNVNELLLKVCALVHLLTGKFGNSLLPIDLFLCHRITLHVFECQWDLDSHLIETGVKPHINESNTGDFQATFNHLCVMVQKRPR